MRSACYLNLQLSDPVSMRESTRVPLFSSDWSTLSLKSPSCSTCLRFTFVFHVFLYLLVFNFRNFYWSDLTEFIPSAQS